jgi:hypothetical protein
MREILVGKRGLVALIDDADFELVSQRHWNEAFSGSRTVIYAQSDVQRNHVRTCVLMHNLIMGAKGIDHIDHDGLNNQRANLRSANGSQSRANTRKLKEGTSRYKGVSWSSSLQKWQAAIMSNGKTTYLGRYDIEEDAARAYDAKARELFGDYAFTAFTNFDSVDCG